MDRVADEAGYCVFKRRKRVGTGECIMRIIGLCNSTGEGGRDESEKYKTRVTFRMLDFQVGYLAEEYFSEVDKP